MLHCMQDLVKIGQCIREFLAVLVTDIMERDRVQHRIRNLLNATTRVNSQDVVG